MMSTVFGIHIGNTNATLAICKDDGRAEVIANDAGDRLTPAVVTITDEETIVGAAAKMAMTSKWKQTICFNKAILIMDQNNLKNLDEYNNIQLMMKNGEINYCIQIVEKVKHVKPQSIVICIFRKLYNIARSALDINGDDVSCVLLASEICSEEYCERYKAAAEAAGWKVLQIIGETAAAVLAYSLLSTKEHPQTVLVYRLGGNTCEITGYELDDGMLYTLGTQCSLEIGGVHLINILVEYLADDFFQKFKLDARENRRSMEKLKLESEKCIHVLSKMQNASCFIESLYDGVDLSVNISRVRFELLIQPVLPKYTIPLKLLLGRLDLEDPVDKVILCGGATCIPKLRSHIASLFDTSTTQILTHLNADEVLALGAAKQAYHLIENGVTDFLPRSMTIHTNYLPDFFTDTSYSFTAEN